MSTSAPASAVSTTTRSRGETASPVGNSHRRPLPAWVVDYLAFGATALLITAVLASRFDYGVVLHDMGTIGHSAERVLNGELPHRDFDDPYTGLLSLLNAAAFRCLGVSLISTRYVLLACTLIGFAFVYVLARRVCGPGWAATTTIAAFLASVPNYFSSMPTWYNLFATLAGMTAMLRYADTGRLRWVVAAGACTGASFLFKSLGLYFAPAAALFAVFVEQRRSAAAADLRDRPHRFASWLTILGLVSYATVPPALVANRFTLPTFLTFVAPSWVLAGYLSWNEYRLRRCDPSARLQSLARIAMAFLAGFVVVVGLFLVPYVAGGDVGAWVHGVFVQPLTRLESDLLGRSFPAGSHISAALLWGAFGIAAAWAGRRAAALRWVWGATALAGLLLLAAAALPGAYAAAWSGGRLVPLVGAIGLAALSVASSRPGGRRREAPLPEEAPRREAAFLYLASAATFGLVQFPLSHGIYFLYVVPLVVLAGVATAAALYPKSRVPQALFLGWTIAFAAGWMLPARTTLLGIRYEPSQKAVLMNAERCPTFCDLKTAHQYDQILRLIREHTSPGSTILAFPDAPQIYFLSERRNPTRTFFEIFDADYGTPEHHERLLQLIDREPIDFVLMRNVIEFSPGALSDFMWNELTRRFPHRQFIDSGGMPEYTVMWRAPAEREAARATDQAAAR